MSVRIWIRWVALGCLVLLSHITPAHATRFEFETGSSSNFASDLYATFFKFDGQSNSSYSNFSVGALGSVRLVVDESTDTVELRMSLTENDAAGLPGVHGSAAELSVSYSGGDIVVDPFTKEFRLNSTFQSTHAELTFADADGTRIELRSFAESPQGGNFPGIVGGPPLLLSLQLVDGALGLYDLRGYFVTAQGMWSNYAAEYGIHTTVQQVGAETSAIPEPATGLLLLTGVLVVVRVRRDGCFPSA